MKVKVEIENGLTSIILLADNDFERDIIEKVKDFGFRYNIESKVETDYSFHTHSNHRIKLDIIKKAEK